jgi:hypothetical protein
MSLVRKTASSIIHDATSEVFTTMKIHVVVFWVVTSCRDVRGYKHFGGLGFFYLQGKDGGGMAYFLIK